MSLRVRKDGKNTRKKQRDGDDKRARDGMRIDGKRAREGEGRKKRGKGNL